MTRRQSGTRQAGFTLIEISVVLVIIALSYGLVAPALSNFISGTRLESASRELALALREARSTAIVTGRALHFQIDPLTGAWDFGERHGAFDRRVAVRLETAADIVFFPDGRTSGGRVRLESAGRARIIEIHWLTGRVSQTAY